jgi:diacylglycerol kinase family enzyme
LAEGVASAIGSKGLEPTLHNSLHYGPHGQNSETHATCIVGGDGTARAILSSFGDDQNPPPMIVYPAGTINLIAREMEYPASIQNICVRIAAFHPRETYSGRVNAQPFLTCASVGPDSYAVASVSLALKQKIGRMAYAAALIRLLWKWPRHIMQVAVDGTIYQAEMILILKGRYYAGPWCADAASSMASDQFRVILLPRVRRRDYMQFLIYLASGRHFVSPEWRFLSARSINIDAKTPLPLQADGDIVTQLPAHISIHPKPVLFL